MTPNSKFLVRRKDKWLETGRLPRSRRSYSDNKIVSIERHKQLPNDDKKKTGRRKELLLWLKNSKSLRSSELKKLPKDRLRRSRKRR
jgi:hypothetical protein